MWKTTRKRKRTARKPRERKTKPPAGTNVGSLIASLSRAPVAVALALFILLLAGQALAHKYYAAETRIDHNREAGTIEVVHRFFAHDVETALTLMTGSRVVIGENDLREDLIRELVEAEFSLTVDSRELPLVWLGAELEGDFLRVYQEAALAGLPRELGVENSLLIEAFAEQINTVTVTFGAKPQSANFRPGDEAHLFSFKTVD